MWILEYLRLVAYALVLIISLAKMFKFPKRKMSIIGDVVISGALMFSIVNFLFLGVDREMSRGLVLTPLSMIWAIIIYINFLKR